MRPLDLAILAVYLVGVTVFGCSFYFRKSAKGTDGFVAGGGTIPSWAIGLSIFATLVSSISFLALPAKAFATNWNALVFSFTVPLTAVVAAFAFVPLYRSLNSVSAYAFLEKRFGAWARMYGSVCFLVMQTARSGVILYLLALLLKTLFGWSVPTIILVVGLATCVYSMLGGVLAVIWTDAIQSLVLIAGTVLCIGVLVFTMPEGIGSAVERIWSEGKLSLGSFSLSDWATETFWVTFAYAVFINLQNLGIDQSYTQRYISAKNGRDAVKSVCFGSFLYLPVTLCFVVIGTLLWAYYTGRTESLPEEIAAVKDSVFPYFIVHSLPVGVTGLLVAAIVAAAMSTVSATLNSGATVIMEDWYKRYFKRDASERACVITLRVSTVFLGLASIAIAFVVIGVESALSTWWMLQSVLSGGMLGLFLLGCVSRRVSSAQAAIATGLGVTTVAWVVFFQKSLHANLSIVFGTCVLFVSGLLMSMLRKQMKMTMKKTLIFAACAASLLTLRADYAPEPWNLAARQKFADQRFGIFIHWGLYANYAQGEWYLPQGKLDEKAYSRMMYGFCPSKFDAKEWVRVFKGAGAKYVTITSRHHDGFSMWPTKADDGYNIGLTPFKRDILGELADACCEAGLQLNFYYSLMDWHRKDYPAGSSAKVILGDQKGNYASYKAFMLAQIAELIDSYHPGNIWFDGEWEHASCKDGKWTRTLDWDFDTIYDFIHSKHVLVANNNHQPIREKEDIQLFERDLPGENGTGFSKDQTVAQDRPIEQCDVIQKNVWGYKIGEKEFRTPEDVCAMICRSAAKDSNLLMNIGPDGSGQLPEKAVAVMAEVGRWMEKNGDAIYGTRGAGLEKSADGSEIAKTRKGDRTFVIKLKPNEFPVVE